MFGAFSLYRRQLGGQAESRIGLLPGANPDVTHNRAWVRGHLLDLGHPSFYINGPSYVDIYVRNIAGAPLSGSSGSDR